MTSKRKIQANRENAKHSTGPKTPEGKAASARNAATHGLSSAFKVLEHEDAGAFADLCDEIAGEFAPKTGHELFLVRQMAESRWRLERSRRYETLALERLLREADETNPEARIVAAMSLKTNNIFDLLRRYAGDAERSYYRAHRELTKGRKDEKQNKATEAQIWLREQIQAVDHRSGPIFDEPFIDDTVATEPPIPVARTADPPRKS